MVIAIVMVMVMKFFLFFFYYLLTKYIFSILVSMLQSILAKRFSELKYSPICRFKKKYLKLLSGAGEVD